MNGKTLLTSIVLIGMAMSAVSCVTPTTTVEDDEDDIVELPLEEEPTASATPAEPEESTTPADESDAETGSLAAAVEAEFGPELTLGAYSTTTDNNQCLDLTGPEPVPIPCNDLDEVIDCILALLGDGGPLGVFCDVDDDATSAVDLGHEGVYTTADGARGEFGASCRVVLIDGQGECTLEIGGLRVTYEPTRITLGERYHGLTLAGPSDPDDELVAALDELAATTGLEAVVRSTWVLYVDDPFVADAPDYAFVGYNALTSLAQHVDIIEGLLVPVPTDYATGP